MGKSATKHQRPKSVVVTSPLRRWVARAVCLIVALGIGALATRDLALSRCERLIAVRDYQSAETWLTVAQWFAPASAQSRWLRARLDRKFGRNDAFAKSLPIAAQARVSRGKIELENLLAGNALDPSKRSRKKQKQLRLNSRCRCAQQV